MKLFMYVAVALTLSFAQGLLWSLVGPPISFVMSGITGFLIGYGTMIVYALRKEQ